MPYIVKCWIAVDLENPEIFETLGDAQQEYNHWLEKFPEDHYEVVEVDKDGEEV